MKGDTKRRLLKVPKFLVRTIWKLFLILLWGCLRLIEVTLTEINQWLKKLIN